MKEQKKRIDFDDPNRTVPVDEYDNLVKKFIPGYDNLFALSEIILAENLPEKAKILVVGAGGGKELATFGKAFPNAEFTGVDPSEKMLALAARNVEKEKLQARVSLIRGTIEDVKEKQFDAATALLVMHFLPDDGEKLRFLQAIYRRLKPNARLILADGCFDKEKKPAEFEWLLNAYQNHARKNGVAEEIIAEAVKMNSENVNCVSAEREIELLRESGFDEIHQYFQGLWFRAWTAVKI
jgi:tRNA (cmo5U34)-methyltransferase